MKLFSKRKMFLLLQNNDAERVSSITGYEEMRFAFQMTNALPHQKRHVTLIRKPVELDETGFSVAEASSFSQKFNNGRFFIEVDIITKKSAYSDWSINHIFIRLFC